MHRVACGLAATVRRFRGVVLSVNLLLALATTGAQAAASQTGNMRSESRLARPALWAVYYAWHTTATGPHGKWSMWSDAKDTSVEPKPLGKASPLIGTYDSDDPDVVRWHMRLAKAAGIDAFLVSWWGGANISGKAFGQLQRGVEAEVGPVYWIMDKVSNANNTMTIPVNWLDIPEIPMFGFYGTFSIKRVWAYDDLMPDYRRVAEAAHAKGKKVFLPVHPGHDNSGFRPDDFFVIPRDEGATLREYLRAATDAGADAILVTSFNEWPETTVVEPSSSWADPYH